MTIKHVHCSTCDIACHLRAVPNKNGKYTLEGDYDHPMAPGAICAKGKLAHDIFEHPNRITKPLKRRANRGDNEWDEISWEQALDEIAEKLENIVDRHGPESLVVSSGPWNIATESGMTRRFLNHLGSPNWIGPVALCMGNTAAVNRLTYGWFPFPDFENTDCVVLFGHNPHKNSWVMEYIRLRRAEQRGAKLIVIDPRRSQSAERATMHLAANVGTDAAFCYGWLNVIITEDLYDHDFVKKWTVGFDKLKKRVLEEYPLKKVAEITGVSVEEIQESARIYANAHSAIIPWAAITDQQICSTSAIRLQSILRAITGNLDIIGGELLTGLNPDLISESELEDHQVLSQAQKEKQFGYHQYPAFTYKSAERLKKESLRVWGHEYPNQIKGICMANPSVAFRAMAYGDPYPAKAFISLANNTLLSYANQALIYEALMNQELLVSMEQFITPTSVLSDYVLPGDSWMERPWIHDTFEWANLCSVSEQLYEPPGECRNVYDFWHGLAHRMGMGEHFPWSNLEELYNYRLSPQGIDWDGFRSTYKSFVPDMTFRKYEKTGFATPSGKVELYSSVLDEFGFDPLPYFREVPGVSDEYPLKVFVGVREPQYFQSGQRHVPSLRKSRPEPWMFVSKEDGTKYSLVHDQWAYVETIKGRVEMVVKIRDDMPSGLVRVPHGWWKPEKDDLGTWDHSDAILVPDSEDYLDREQGIPHLKGIPCKVYSK